MNINFFQGKKFSEQKFRGLVFTKTLMKVVMTVLVMVLSFSALLPFAHAEYDHMDKRKKCTMTIESNKHTFDSPAQASGVCNGMVRGYYVPEADQFNVIGVVNAEITKNGQIILVPNPFEDYSPSLTVYIVRQTPPAKPKEEKPKQEKPKEEKTEQSKPKEQKPKGEMMLV